MNKKKVIGKVAAILVLLISVLIMLYPFLSAYLFQNRQDSIIETYTSDSESLKEEQVQAELAMARAYNQDLLANHIVLQDPFENEVTGVSQKQYESVLNESGNGLMGYIRIPCIDVELPIYHGTSEQVLENGVGHLEGTSFPVGGESTHAVLTGHTGLNRAKLFTDLTLLENGDTFYINVLNEKLAYEVDQVMVVLPDEIVHLTIEDGKDYCTLITCTPYGINSHRLFVRGRRIPYSEEGEQDAGRASKTEQSQWMREYVRAMLLGVATIVILLVVYELCSRKKPQHIDK